MLFTSREIEIHVIAQSYLYLSRFQFSESTMIIYRKGARGQPCQSPLELSKNSLGLPLPKGTIQGPTMQDLIISI